MKTFDAASGRERVPAAGHGGETITACRYSPDGGRLLSGAWDGSLKLWERETGAELASLSGHDGWIEGCGFSPTVKMTGCGYGTR